MCFLNLVSINIINNNNFPTTSLNYPLHQIENPPITEKAITAENNEPTDELIVESPTIGEADASISDSSSIDAKVDDVNDANVVESKETADTVKEAESSEVETNEGNDDTPAEENDNKKENEDDDVDESEEE